MADQTGDYPTYIRQQGFRLTSQRQLILAAVAEIAGHCTPEQVYDRVRDRMPTINRATVYRTLEFFLEIGLVTVAQIEANQTVYELAAAVPHHHLLCQRCHRLTQIDHIPVAAFFAELERQFHFQVRTDHLVLFGFCQHCREQGRSAMVEPQVSEIYNFLPIDERWATAGQPTAQQFAAIKQAGYEVIINLGMPDSPRSVADEAVLVAAQGLDYIAIPVVWDAPTADNLTAFFAAMTANQTKKRFVHCIANMRVSAFTFLYRVLVLGVPVTEARQTLHQIWEPNPIWQQFIDEQLAKHHKLTIGKSIGTVERG